jgi:PAS domain S-box-containing protein
MDLSEYVLEPIHTDDALVLYRGPHRATTGSNRSILVLKPVSDRPAPGTIERLEHEYSLARELDPAFAARPIALTDYQGRTALVLEDPGGEPLDRLLGKPLEMGQFLRIAVGLSAALAQLHARALIHKDIKPANVLVNQKTSQIRLMGFGIASRLPRERQAPAPPEFIAGTLPYMAPEQTGRMNRSIDSRSDLYAFGVTLYEMVTGSVPFTASDPMELVHCHVARQPVPPAERSQGIPRTVSEIVMKLLAKTADKRYQTATGVESDLRRCLGQWEAQHSAGAHSSPSSFRTLSRGVPPPGWLGPRIDEFPLGEQDTPDRLLIPEKLYGRAAEIDTLLATLDRVVTGGRPELVLVSGYAGVGKSSVVNELHKALVPSRALFASGKFDQYKRDVPYATLAQAFQSLLRPLLAEREEELGRWRDVLRAALEPNGQLIVDLVPELELIIGEQPPPLPLPPQEEQGRFQLVLRRFIGVFARPEHPLVLFLDDLQWLDAATLESIEDLLIQSDVRHLMLIGAYRDNEVDSYHPLKSKLDAIRKTGATVREIVLAPLTHEELARFIADCLHCDPGRSAPLAQLIHEKTAGNPFFAIQFISAIAEEGLLTFDHGEGRWSWDLPRIRAKGYTDNVVDLMLGKLKRLASDTHKPLQLLACIGNSAEFALLEMVSQDSNEEMHARLSDVVRAGLIFRGEHSYSFLHDRVQEAAYSLIPEQARAEVHLRIGRLLVAHAAPESREERIFEIVNQLNRGAALITSRDERTQLAELNLIAGKRAKASTAYTSALRYFVTGASLLVEDSWQQLHDLVFPLELHRAECEFLTGQLAAAAERLIMLSSRAANTVELATVTCLRVDLYTTLNQNDRAVGVCLEYLRHLGIEWAAHPKEEEVRQEYDRIASQLGNRAIEQLIDLHMMSDPASLATLEVLTKVLPPALFTDANLLSLATCRAVNLSLEQGNSDASCVAYVWLGQIAGPHFGNYKAGYQFGRLGCDLVEQRGLKRFRVRAYMVFGSHVIPWTKHLGAGRELVHRSFVEANEIGDLCYAAYSCHNLNTNLLTAGAPLSEVQREAENGLRFVQKVRFGLVRDHIRVHLGFIRTLRGLTPTFGSFNDDQFDELRFEHHLASDPALAQSECFYWVRQLQARFFAGHHASALEASLRAQRLLWSVPSNLETADYHLYSALSRAASWDSASGDERRQHFDALSSHKGQLEIWAENCPENFENRAALVGAEIARIESRDVDAMRLYEQSIRSARANGFVHNEALANELAARFYAARGFEQIARLYLRNARHCYVTWGADGKARQLDELHSQLVEEERARGPMSTITAPVEHLDLATVLKLSQAVSGELVLEKLIDTLLRTAIEHAGAERGLLILPHGAELRIRAEANTSGSTVMIRLRDTSTSARELPEAVIHYAARTQENVILDDAVARGSFSDDEYIRQKQARSILCVPLVKQGRLIAVLYLENNLAANVFTPSRVAVLKILASAAAISLENSRLYRDLEAREAKIRRLVDANVVGVLISDLDGRIIEANDAFLRMLGYARDDVTSGRLRGTELIPPEWMAASERAVSQLKMTGTCEVFEMEFVRRDGGRVPALLAAAVIEGTPAQAVVFVADLTERKRAEEERERLRQAQADLARISRIITMGEMTASLAHEITQPITAASTDANACLRWLTRDEPDVGEAREAAKRLVKATTRAGEIIRRIRSMFRKGRSEREPVNVNDLLTEIVMLVRSEAMRYGVSIRTDCAADVPFVMGDRVQLQQVLLNLIVNGIEATKAVDGRREITIGSRPDDGNRLLVSVADTGVGLPPNPDEMFKAFFTTKAEGTGMGLAISRSIIESHGGRLWATSNENGGATFFFTLNREEADRARNAIAASQ